MYKHKQIEKKWQEYWENNQTFKTTNKYDKKFYVLDMFPYPSGSGLHVGHPEGYTATDIVARYKRLQGFDVLHPIGWDAFGLPAEQYAIKTGNHPRDFTNKNIGNFRRQLKSIGFSFDYNKEVNTTDPQYYKTTQWIFSKMHEKGLAEIKEIDVNWCEGLGTVLANEEILDGPNGEQVSERGNFPVVKKPMKQWVLKITKYAEELFNDMDELDWPSSLVSLQKNWIKNDDGTLHLRDWIFSRQRYWGEPFPVVMDGDDVLLITDLPVLLPDMDEIKPSGTGESPLANNKEWLNYEKDGKTYKRETNTMPQWAGSSWYYLAYILKNDDGTYTDIDSDEAFKGFEKWLPVDLYVGGQEHAVLHLLYARFWHKVLYDLKIVPTKEPFFKIVNQGMILGTDGSKMSKSKGNVINPDIIIEELGADTLRIYEMFMGPLEDTKAWSTESIKGVKKWLDRVWRIFETVKIGKSEVASDYNKLIMESTQLIEDLKFNVVISKMMIFINSLYKKPSISKEEARGFLVLLSCYAPHVAEELLEINGEKSIEKQTWPTFDKNLINDDSIIIAVQVNGKLRGTIELNNLTKDELISESKKIENVSKYLEGKNIVKEIYVMNKIINLVVK